MNMVPDDDERWQWNDEGRALLIPQSRHESGMTIAQETRAFFASRMSPGSPPLHPSSLPRQQHHQHHQHEALQA